MSGIEPRPVPKALIWGLIGGFLLFAAIIAGIVMSRERTEPEKPQASESRSESPPQ